MPHSRSLALYPRKFVTSKLVNQMKAKPAISSRFQNVCASLARVLNIALNNGDSVRICKNPGIILKNAAAARALHIAAYAQNGGCGGEDSVLEHGLG